MCSAPIATEPCPVSFAPLPVQRGDVPGAAVGAQGAARRQQRQCAPHSAGLGAAPPPLAAARPQGCEGRGRSSKLELLMWMQEQLLALVLLLWGLHLPPLPLLHPATGLAK